MEDKMSEFAIGQFIGFYLPNHALGNVKENASMISLQCVQDTLPSPAERSSLVVICFFSKNDCKPSSL